MPIFVLSCEECKIRFEIISTYDELDTEQCIVCSSKNLTRVVSAFGSYTIKGDNSASTRPKGGGGRK